MKITRIVLALILAASISLHFPVVSFVKVSADAGTIFDLVIEDYYKYSGKYLIYFTEIDGSKGYRVYIDDGDTPVKTITTSGGYITADDLSEVADGTHLLKLVSVNDAGQEAEYATANFTKEGDAGTYTDIPQVYIYTPEEITKDYHSTPNVDVTLVDKDGGVYSDIIDSESNIKIRGNSTATADKKPWNIKFDSKKKVMGMNKGKKWCLLANIYDKSLMRNKLALEMGHKINMSYTPESRYVEVIFSLHLLR